MAIPSPIPTKNNPAEVFMTQINVNRYKNLIEPLSFMKKLVFIELEGVLSDFGQYVPNSAKVGSFLKELSSFCKTNKIELYLISGYHESIAKKNLSKHKFEEFFDENHFLCVDDIYIASKAEGDKKLHEENMKKNPEFNDTFFKQIIIQQILKKMDLNEKDALLLSDDVWVDGYYTSRFSKIDFAIFESNVLDRGKPIDRLNGLAYFSLEFSSVKQLLENFPVVNLASLEKYVFETMRDALVGSGVKDSIKSAMQKKMEKR